MSESLGTAVLELSTKDNMDKGFDQGLRKTKGFMKNAGHTMSSMGRNMSLAVTGPLLLLGKMGADELGEIDKANAQTAAGIKSTGGAAGVSADHIQKLAGNLQLLSGQDDQAIQSGENLLLTFTGIKNAAGKGNDIFDQTSLAMTNMSARMGMDASGAALQLGKALNDPIKGVSKLQRVGVTFTDGQKSQIAAMTKAGNTIGAQKVMLKELNKEFGGSAAAAGKTFPAQLAVLKDSFAGVAASVIRELLPSLRQFITFAQGMIAKFQALSPHTKKLIASFALLAAAVGPVLMIVGPLVVAITALATPVGAIVAGLAILGGAWLRQGNHMKQAITALGEARARMSTVVTWIKTVAWPAIVEGAQKAMTWYRTQIAPTIMSVLASVKATLTQWIAWGKAAWEKWGADITAVVKTAFNLVATIAETGVKIIGGVIKTVLALLRGDWKGAWDSLKGTVSAALNGAIAIVRALGPALLAQAKLLWSVIKTAVPAALSALGQVLVAAVKGAASGVWALAGWLKSEAIALGKAIIDGVVSGIQAGASAITNAMTSLASNALSAAKGKLGIHSPSTVFRDQVGLPMVQGIAAGFTLGLPGVLTAQRTVLENLKAASDIAVASARKKADQAKSALDAVGSLKEANAALVTADRTAHHRILAAQVGVRDAQRALSDARKSKNHLDIRAAQDALTIAKVELKTQKKAVSAAVTHVGTLKILEKAYDRAQAAADKAERDAEAAQKKAQDALDAAEKQQSALEQALTDIKESSDLALNRDRLQEALQGGVSMDTATERIGILKNEYMRLMQYLTDNGAQMSTSAVNDVISTMADITDQIAGAQQAINDITNPPKDDTPAAPDPVVPAPDPIDTITPVTPTPGDSGGGGGGGGVGPDPYATQLQIIQQFSSEPDMFAASRAAAFAYNTAGLVGG